MQPFLSLIAVVVALTGAAPQRISDRELTLFIGRAKFPIGCQDAALAVNRIRVMRHFDAAELRDASKTFRACATGNFGLNSNPLANLGNFTASAAALLAARYEPTANGTHDDATAAARFAQIVVDYRNPGGRSGRSRPPDPSPYTTDAQRIKRDADALLAAPLAPQ